MTAYDFETLPISDDWAAHRARKSLGGTDFKTPVGRVLRAPADGTVDYRTAGSGGWTCRIRYDNGYAHEFMHILEEQPFEDGTRVRVGDAIALSGGERGHAGAGSSTGPHIHVHGITPTGVRVRYNQVVLPTRVILAAALKPVLEFDWNEPELLSIRKVIQDGLKERGRYAGPIDGDWAEKTITGIQRTVAIAGFYPGRIDGDPEGPLTCWAVQAYAQKFGGYDGPLDKKLGANSWLGFARGLNPDFQ